MAIVKKKSKSGKVYYFNTATKKFASEAAYKRSKGQGSSVGKSKIKGKTGRLTTKTCSTAGRNLKVRRTSSAGRTLRRCR